MFHTSDKMVGFLVHYISCVSVFFFFFSSLTVLHFQQLTFPAYLERMCTVIDQVIYLLGGSWED